MGDDVTVLCNVIRTRRTGRGDGVNTTLRIITQYWSSDGELLAEVDPCPDDEVVTSTGDQSPGWIDGA